MTIPEDRHRHIRPRRCSGLWIKDPKSLTGTVISDARLLLDTYRLNKIGTLLWELCDGTRTVEHLSDLVVAGCDGSVPRRRQIIADIMDFVNALRDRHLLTWDEGTLADVLLVVPPFPSCYAPEVVKVPEFSSPPLGLCYIAAVLRQHGHSVEILDLHQSAGRPEHVVEACTRTHARIIGITATTPTYPNALRVARFIKAWNPAALTVLGGPHATAVPEDCARSGAFDCVCVGEGERTMAQIADAVLGAGLPVNDIAGVVSYHNGRITAARPRARIRDLDDIPMPARNLLTLGRYHHKGAIVSSRGCSIGCDFCSCAAIAGRTYRTRSVPHVVQEMDHVKKTFGVRHFDFHDDTFNLQAPRVFRFCQEIETARLDVRWGCFCRAAQMTPKMASAMAKAGCRVVQFGVESGNGQVMQGVGKRTSVHQVEQAVRAATKAGIEQIACGFIIGHASDTEESVGETIAFGLRLRSLGATRLTLSLLTPYPGTKVFEERDALGISLLTDDWEQYTFSRVVMETRHLRKDRLRELYTEGLCRFLDASTS